MRIEINGEARDVERDITVTELLRTLGIDTGPVAVERNREIVPRTEHPTTQLHEGDVLEVVHFVGGG